MKIPVTFLLLAFFLHASAQRLLPVIDADLNLPLDVLNGEIQAMTTWNGNLIAAGKIESVNGMSCNQIFQWDGTHYSTLGNGWAQGGSSQNIQCLTVYDNMLIAGGRLDAGGGNEYVIQSFDGSTWGNYSPYDFDGAFTDMIVYDGLLVVSGRFNDLFYHVAAYNGSEWLTMGSAFNDDVLDLAVYNGELYAGGLFTQNAMEVTELNHFAKWNGEEWEQPGSGLNGAVNSMVVFGNELILGGDFDAIIDGSQTGHLCKWNGAQLTNFDQQVDHETYELFMLNGQFGYVELLESNLLHLHIGEELIRYRGMFGPVIFRKPTIYIHDDTLFVAVDEHNSLMEYDQEYPELMSGLMYLESGTDEVFLDVNNARVPIRPLPTFFQDPLLMKAGFEIPAGSGVSPLYAASIWASGINTQGDSLVAATLYSTDKFGWSFGPVSSTLSHDYLEKYHRVWKVSAEQIEEHQTSFQDVNYSIPEAILNWPCNGNILNGEAHHLASFEDLNENGWYEPLLGEYPIIPGDECVYIILNDRYLQTNYPSVFSPMDLEAHVMFYGFSNQPEPIQSTVFMKTKVFNRSEVDYLDFRISSWSDFDLGTGFDDYVGSDSLAMISYCYNGDSFDEASSASFGYGELPPAFGSAFLNQDMAAVCYYNNASNPINGEPTSPEHFFNYARGKNKMGGDFQIGDAIISPFAYNGSICTGSGELEANLGNPPADRRSVASTTPSTLPHGQFMCFEMAYMYYRNEAFNHLENACGLIQAVPVVNSFFQNNQSACAVEEFAVDVDEKDLANILAVYPNPAQETITIETKNRTIYDYTISDAMGKVVGNQRLTNEVSSQTISVAELAPGLYFIMLNAGNYSSVVRFVKN